MVARVENLIGNNCDMKPRPRFEIIEQDIVDIASHMSKELKEDIVANDVKITPLQHFAQCKENLRKIKSRVWKVEIGGVRETFVMKRVYGGIPDILRDRTREDVEAESKFLEIFRNSVLFNPRYYEFAERHIQTFPKYFGALEVNGDKEKKRINTFIMEFIKDDTLDTVVEKKKNHAIPFLRNIDWNYVKDYLDPIILLHVLSKRGKVRTELSAIIEKRNENDYADHYTRYLELISETDKNYDWENPGLGEVADAVRELSKDVYTKHDLEEIIHGTALPEHVTQNTLIDAGSLRISSIGLDLGCLYGFPSIFNNLVKTEGQGFFKKVVETYLEKEIKLLDEIDPLKSEYEPTEKGKTGRINLSMEIDAIAGAYFGNLRRAGGLLELAYPYESISEVKKELKDLKIVMKEQFDMLYNLLGNKSYMKTLSELNNKLEIFNEEKDYDASLQRNLRRYL